MTLVGSKVVFIFLIALSVWIAVEDSSPQVGFTEVVPFRIHLQTSSAAELELLPGIGPKTAQRIIEYRELHVIRSPDDLRGVHGIGQLTVERLRDLTAESRHSK